MPRNKYGAVKTRIGDKVFASKAEALQYVILRQREKNGEIKGLRCQAGFQLTACGQRIGRYIADFVFFENGKEVALEVKGAETTMWKWKKKHFLVEYKNIELRIVKA